MKVYESIAQVSAELAHSGISKDRNNAQQGYKFRGIDDCLNALAPLLSKHHLVLLPEVLEREKAERETKQGGALFYVTVKVKYVFVNTEDFSKHDVVTYGEAMDTADKATNKAMSAAYKYAVIQAFCIPTEGDNDADATTHEVKAQSVVRHKQTAQAKINELRSEGAASVSSRTDPATSAEQADTLTPMKDLTISGWGTLLGGMENDPDLADLLTMVKEQVGLKSLAYPKVSPKDRVEFLTALQKAAIDNGLAGRMKALGL